jgi:hypothetical protein
MHPADLPPSELLEQCEVTRTRRSGPGGQNRNKVETAIVLAHRPTGVTAQASERRSQAENQQMALFRLRVQLAIRIRTAREPGSSPLWQSRLRGTCLEISETHDDFPPLLAESLDLHAQLDGHLQEVAAALGTTVSQLTKLWKKAPEALLRINEDRSRRGLRELE